MYVRNNDDRTVFYHFAGAVPLSTSLSDMLQRLLKDLCNVSRDKKTNYILHFTKY